MTTVKRYIREFFYPAETKYSYKQSKYLVTTTIFRVLDDKPTTFGEKDMEGHYLGEDKFEFKLALRSNGDLDF